MKSDSDSTEGLRSDGEEPSPPRIEDITGSRRAGPRTFEPPMLTGRGILVSCIVPAFFFALLNVFFLSDSVLQALAAFVKVFLEVKKVEVVGIELGLTPQGIAFVTIALLWGLLIWLARYPILSLYSPPIPRPKAPLKPKPSVIPKGGKFSFQRLAPLLSPVRWCKRWLLGVAGSLKIPPGRLTELSRESDDLIRMRYGLEAQLVWPRLESVVPDKYLNEIENSDIFIHLFLNLSISAFMFAVETLVAMVWMRSLSLAIIGIVNLAFYYMFYRAAIPVMGRRLLWVQSCFDLFRMDLLKQMRIPLPETLEDEFVTWTIVRGLLLADLDPSLVRYVTADKDEQT
jgi:hypothetical protein